MYKKLTACIALIFCLGFGQLAAASGNYNYTALLGVNDTLTETQPELRDGNYYAPVRELALALGLQLSGTPGEIYLADQNQSTLVLKPAEGKVVRSDGTEETITIKVEQGMTRVPVAFLAREFGYQISYLQDSRLLRLLNTPGVLTDEQFIAKYSDAIAKNKTRNTEMEKQFKAEKDRANNQAQKDKKNKPATSQTKPNQSKTTAKQPVYLTFDDGPTAHTGQLLDILKKFDAKATFFMLGNHIDTYSSSVKRLVKEGHQPALHGMTHVKEEFYKSPDAALKEMDDDNEQLFKAAKVKSKLIRSPYGSKPDLVQAFRDKLITHGYRIWDWNVDSEDWKYKSNSKEIYKSVMDQVHNQHKKGIAPIILLHDQEDTLKVLPSILAALKKEGYSFELITSDMKPHNFWEDVR